MPWSSETDRTAEARSLQWETCLKLGNIEANFHRRSDGCCYLQVQRLRARNAQCEELRLSGHRSGQSL